MIDPQLSNIWIQLGTRLHMLVYKRTHWEVWTSTDHRRGDSSSWHGTFIRVMHNGEAYQVTRDRNGAESEMRIR